MTFESVEQARASIAPGDVVVAKGHVLRAVDVRSEHSLGAVRETSKGAARTMIDLDWALVDEYHHRDDVDVDALLEDLAPDEADQRDLVDEREQADQEDVETAVDETEEDDDLQSDGGFIFPADGDDAGGTFTGP